MAVDISATLWPQSSFSGPVPPGQSRLHIAAVNMMRGLIVGLVLIAALVCVAQAANECACTCCRGEGCTPQRFGPQPVTLCSSCTPEFCRDYFDDCPSAGEPGALSGECYANEPSFAPTSAPSSSIPPPLIDPVPIDPTPISIVPIIAPTFIPMELAPIMTPVEAPVQPPPFMMPTPPGSNVCFCECCRGPNCIPIRLGPSAVTFCTSCNDVFCRERYEDDCPAFGDEGIIRGECAAPAPTFIPMEPTPVSNPSSVPSSAPSSAPTSAPTAPVTCSMPAPDLPNLVCLHGIWVQLPPCDRPPTGFICQNGVWVMKTVGSLSSRSDSGSSAPGDAVLAVTPAQLFEAPGSSGTIAQPEMIKTVIIIFFAGVLALFVF